MSLSTIKSIAILVELENGDAHQVLTSKQNKEILLQMLTAMDDGVLRLSEEIEPVRFEARV